MGGFFEHVPPPAGPVTAAEQALGDTDGLRGFRVPCVVISPWSQQRRVSRQIFDHTSILKLIEWRFQLQPLSVRDAQANNLATVLDFDHPRLEVPQPTVPPGLYGGVCPATPESAVTQAAPGLAPENEWLPEVVVGRKLPAESMHTAAARRSGAPVASTSVLARRQPPRSKFVAAGLGALRGTGPPGWTGRCCSAVR